MQRPIEKYGWTETRKNTYGKITKNKRLTEITFRNGKVEIQGEIEKLEELIAIYDTAKKIMREGDKLCKDHEELQVIY